VRVLHGRTLCLVGDSFDKQLFVALQYALERLKDKGTTACDSGGDIDSVVTGSADASCIHTPTVKWWGAMKDVPFVKVLASNGTLLARVRYIKMYAAEMNVFDKIERYCDVAAMLFAFHWDASSNWKGRDSNSFLPLAIESAAMFLANFSAAGKVAIWRGASARHFPNGHYDKDRKNMCEPYNPTCSNDEQEYNTVSRRVFDRMARGSPPLPGAQGVAGKSLTPDEATMAAWAELRASPCTEQPFPTPSVYTITCNQLAG
jgi:hypothetical protein